MKIPHSSASVPANFSEEKTYLCDYQYEGALWSVEIVASSFEDAERRLRALGRGKVAGEVQLVIPVPTKWTTRLVELVASIRNLAKQLSL